MTTFWSSEKLDPRASLTATERARLRQMSGAVARAVWDGLMATLGLDEDTVWRLETGRDEHGWTPEEAYRRGLWEGAQCDVERAAAALREQTHREFARHLLATGRIGVGDDAKAVRA